MGQVPHLTEGGCHGQYNSSVPQTFDQGRNAVPTDANRSKGSRVSTPARSDPSTIAQAGSRRLGPSRICLLAPDPPPIRFSRRRRHPDLGWTHHRQSAPLPWLVGPRALQQLSPRLLPRRWSSWKLARQFAHTVLSRFVPQGPIELAGDDTVTEHPGPHVYGKGCHRDPVRSTHSFTAYRWGHKWVALTVLVKVPWATRRWALPVLIALYQTPGKRTAGKSDGTRHRRS